LGIVCDLSARRRTWAVPARRNLTENRLAHIFPICAPGLKASIEFGQNRAPMWQIDFDKSIMVAKGYPNKTIAAVLEISSWTVCTHMRRIFAKLSVGSRAAIPERSKNNSSFKNSPKNLQRRIILPACRSGHPPFD
jgi:hypothetical protein